MVSTWRHDGTRPALRIVLAALAAVLIVIGGPGAEARAAAPQQKTFKSPEAVVKALIDAAAAQDVKALVSLFGPGSEDLVSSGDDAADARFVSRDEAMALVEWDETRRVISEAYARFGGNSPPP